MLWQYRTMLFEFTKDGLLGDKYVDDEEMEKTLNQMGGQGWELVSVTLLQDGVLAFLKKPVGQERLVDEPIVVVAPPPQPVIRSRQAVAPPRTAFVEPGFEPEPEAQPAEPIRVAERQRKPAAQNDEPDFLSSIRIS